ncbi:F-box protein SKIP24 isoform X3 [Elaeis guineensis]
MRTQAMREIQSCDVLTAYSSRCVATRLEYFLVFRVSPVPLLPVDRQSTPGARVMSILPDEIWSRILELGTETSRLGYRDLCCLAISCRRLRRLSQDHALWSTLLAIDFPQEDPSSLSQTPSKSLYKTRFERDKARRHAVWRRAVLNAGSQVFVCRKKLKDLESLLLRESERMKAAVEELANVERVSSSRRASVALNVWQPEVVRGSQRQIVEQCTVPIESRLSALKMEVRVCKQQIAIFEKAYNEQKKKFSEYKEALASLRYNPLQNNQSGGTSSGGHGKRKKLKRSNDCTSHDYRFAESCLQDHWEGK